MTMAIVKNRVYLLYPPISKMERYSSAVGSVGGEQIPLGIFYLASYLRENGYNVKVTDAEANKLNEKSIIDEIKEYEPSYIGISSTTVAFHRALSVAKAIKNVYPKLPIIIGGPHVTSNATHALNFNEFDFGVIGEGEITIVELLDALGANKPISTIKGICYRNNNEIIINARREYISNLDVLPFPAYDLIPEMSLYSPPPSNYKTLPVINIITSRGCPSLCTFCDRNIFGMKYRERSAENVYREIKHLYDQYGIKEIAFVDDTFLINKKRVRDLFELIKKNKLFFDWTCMARINNVDFEFLNYLKKNGCWNIAFGIESGDENVLKVIKKNITINKVKEVINMCDKLSIRTKGFFIIGHPTETLETIDKTIKFACSLKLDAVVVTINTPIPGSQQYAEAETYGSLDTTDWSKFNYWRPVFIPKGLTEDVLLKKQKSFYLRFYSKPRIILRYLGGFFGKGGIKRFKSIVGLLAYALNSSRATKTK